MVTEAKRIFTTEELRGYFVTTTRGALIALGLDDLDAGPRPRPGGYVELSEAAWAAIEHRPRLLVGSTEEIGDDDVMVVSASATDLLAALDEALGAMLDDGTYQRIFGAYLPGATLPGAVGT